MNDKAWGQAAESFEYAEEKFPKVFGKFYASWDLASIYTQKGIALHQKALSMWKENGLSLKVLDVYIRSKKSLDIASQVDPMIYNLAYWTAMTVNSMEVLYPGFSKVFKAKPNADPLYQKAIALRPNGVSGYYSYARYLNSKKKYSKLTQIVRQMAQVHPQVYRHIRKEPFFNEELLEHCRQGLLIALDQRIAPFEAHRSLSKLYEDLKDYTKSIEHFEKSIGRPVYTMPLKDYMKMGLLHLKNNRSEQSSEWFIKALQKVSDFQRALNNIYDLYKKEDRINDYLKFSSILQKEFPSSVDIIDLQVAKAWMAKGDRNLAKARLLRMIGRKSNAQAHFLLAKIFQKEKNWDQMEIHAQKATTLNKGNEWYHHWFAVSLQYQKKYSQAAKAATKAIENAKDPNPWHFHQRAWALWGLKKYREAGQDWIRASELKPDFSEFFYMAAFSLEKQGFFKDGLTYIDRAIAITPQKKYKTLKQRLLTHQE